MDEKRLNNYKIRMNELVEKRQKIDSGEITYEELKQMEKNRLETRMGDLIQSSGYNPELEELIPEPIQWQ